MCVLVYDITRRQSFEHIQGWLKEAREHGGEKMEVLLVGNKCDRETARNVTYEEGQRLAQNNNISFLETSAKTNQNVEQAFTIAASHVLQKVQDGLIDPNDEGSGVKVQQFDS